MTVSARAGEIRSQLQGNDAPVGSIWVDSLDLSHATQGSGTAQAGHSMEGRPITLAGVVYPHGVGTHAAGSLVIDLHGAALRFQSVVGLDDERKGLGSVTFSVWVDGKKIQETPVMRGGDQPQPVSIDLTGAKQLALCVGDGGDGITNDHADWAGAMITLAAGAEKPQTVDASAPRLRILPPDPQTAIHGARIVGATPGHPFLFPIAATGTAPLAYSAQNLPGGLTLDAKTGIISGALAGAGRTQVALTVSGPGGMAHRNLTVVGGDHPLSLTPAMGWNSWNVWGNTVTEKKTKDAADEFVSLGLVGHGYQYINIDQGWQGTRDNQGNITSNADFPDMKGLSDYIHSKGMKVGLYSAPGPQTCGPFPGSYQHEAQDARTYAKWGFDYLKYDWCAYEDTVHGDHSEPVVEKPYRTMGQELIQTDRDILFSLCVALADPWTWGGKPEIHASSWRTYGDIQDVWTAGTGLYDIIEAMNGIGKYGGPGHGNDEDILMVGIVGYGNTRPTNLTPNEQITHVSMWCMFASPILAGCDLTKLDPFTLALLTNDEVLDIDQDPLGKPAARVGKNPNGGEVWSRELFDGTRAVGLLNPAPVAETITANWSDIGLAGKQPVRDLWMHQDMGSFDRNYSALVPSHGTVLVKVGSPVGKD